MGKQNSLEMIRGGNHFHFHFSHYSFVWTETNLWPSQEESGQTRVREKLPFLAFLLTRKGEGDEECIIRLKQNERQGNSGLEGQMLYVSYSLWILSLSVVSR